MRCLALIAFIMLATPNLATAQWRFVVFGGAGFSGRNVERAVAGPAFNGNLFVPDSVDLRKDTSYDWRPAISSGLEVRRAQTDSSWYLGIAGFFSALNEVDEKTSIWPGIALTFGKGTLGVVVGYIATASNNVASNNVFMPEGGLRVKRDAIPDLSTEGTKSFGRIYIGFRGIELKLGGA
jgi:hypothetical protein